MDKHRSIDKLIRRNIMEGCGGGGGGGGVAKYCVPNLAIGPIIV